jgi:hypothetical protein
MARGDTGTVTVVAGAATQITSSLKTQAEGQRVRSSQQILALSVTPRATNTGVAIYVGGASVSTTHGRRVAKGDEHTFQFEPGTDDFTAWYVDGDSSGDLVDWEILF